MHASPDAQDSHDLGLQADLRRILLDAARRETAARRDALRWLCGALMVPLAGCGGGSDDSSTSTDSTSTSFLSNDKNTPGSCSVINEETAGPFPGDGSNSSSGSIANALSLSGIVRSDIRSSIAGATGVAAGVPLTVRIVLVNTNGGCAALDGYAIYLWHADALGRYSMYSSGVTGENYLRGVQPTDSSGQATFLTVYPGCYDGRMPHMHFEVFRSTTTASSFSNKLRTSQIAFPNEVSSAVYATSTYPSSASNLSRISFSSDNVFSDGVSLQLATVTGSVSEGYVATLRVGIAA
jgi:protocatechuate 3,4-dioxygenase beta subunit